MDSHFVILSLHAELQKCVEVLLAGLIRDSCVPAKLLQLCLTF